MIKSTHPEIWRNYQHLFARPPSPIQSQTRPLLFSQSTPLSQNHHPSIFTLKGEKFHNMEQYLAPKRAQLSEQESIIRWASQATDPKVAKVILESLREDHAPEWDQQVEEITLVGLRAKFSQNKHLLASLKNTQQLQIGETSSNPHWGIGLDHEDPQVLDTMKWNQTGNLLGRCLMTIRTELCPTSGKTPSKKNK